MKRIRAYAVIAFFGAVLLHGCAPKQQALTEEPKRFYEVSANKRHLIVSNASFGEYIILDDGSEWEISPLDNYTAMTWQNNQAVVVILSSDPDYPYLIINRDKGTMIEAKLVRY
jgi:exosome complex RNA-binding protein Rrp42 (RNase PH superfamily)